MKVLDFKREYKVFPVKPIHKPVYPKQNSEPAAPRIKQNPLVIAHAHFGKRLVEKNGMYWLDGLPVSLNQIMRALNKMFAENDIEQITYSEQWKVDILA